MNRFLPACLAVFAALSAALFIMVPSNSTLPHIPPAQEWMFRLPLDHPEELVHISFDLSDERSTAHVYQASYRTLDEADARDLADRFGVATEPQLIPTPERAEHPAVLFWPGFRFEGEKARLEVLLNGSVTLTRHSTKGEVVQLNEDQAKERAIEFLSACGVLPQTAEVYQVRFLGVPEQRNTVVTFADKRLRDTHIASECQPIPKMSAQVKMCNIGALSPLIEVVFDDLGTVDEVRITDWPWPDIKRVGDYPIVSEEEAYRRILEGLGAPSYRLSPDNVESIQLISVTLEYRQTYEMDQRRIVGPIYYVPFYRFRTDGDYQIVVPALTDEYLFPPGYEWIAEPIDRR